MDSNKLPPAEFVKKENNENNELSKDKYQEIVNNLNIALIKCEQNTQLIIKLFEMLHKK